MLVQVEGRSKAVYAPSRRFTVRLALISLLALAQPVLSAPFTATEMMKLKRLADPAVSPDGKWVAYQATEVELPSGARNTDVFLVPLAGGEPRRLTSHSKSDTRPRFSPDGKRLAFLSNRDGGSQVYLLELAGGEAIRATALADATTTDPVSRLAAAGPR